MPAEQSILSLALDESFKSKHFSNEFPLGLHSAHIYWLVINIVMGILECWTPEMFVGQRFQDAVIYDECLKPLGSYSMYALSALTSHVALH